MCKQICFIVFLFISCCLWSEQNYVKIGKIPNRSPYQMRTCSVFLPYNPIILTIGPPTEHQIIECAELRKKGIVYCFEQDRGKFQRLRQKTQNLTNVYLFPFSFGPESDISLDDWCKSNHLSKIDVLSLDANGEEAKILCMAENTIKTARVIFVSTYDIQKRQKSFQKIQSFLAKCNFTLVSHWREVNGRGRAFFVKTNYYKGVYERKLI